MNIIEIAKGIATRAHHGQYRRDGVTPYITHPAAVVARLEGESPEVLAAAWLHDVLEDTSETSESLLAAGIPDDVVFAVEILTKIKGESYEDYLGVVRASSKARKVKVADMLHNLSDTPTDQQITKYSRGLLFLQAG